MILSYIAFADDLALITYTALEMNILLERLKNTVRKLWAKNEYF